MVKRAVEMEGTVTVSVSHAFPLLVINLVANVCIKGEHGVGLVKRDYLPHELGENTVDMMRKVSVHSYLDRFRTMWILTVSEQIKMAFDPLCLLNCDKVVRMQKPAPGEVKKW